MPKSHLTLPTYNTKCEVVPLKKCLYMSVVHTRTWRVFILVFGSATGVELYIIANYNILKQTRHFLSLTIKHPSQCFFKALQNGAASPEVAHQLRANVRVLSWTCSRIERSVNVYVFFLTLSWQCHTSMSVTTPAGRCDP